MIIHDLVRELIKALTNQGLEKGLILSNLIRIIMDAILMNYHQLNMTKIIGTEKALLLALQNYQVCLKLQKKACKRDEIGG